MTGQFSNHSQAVQYFTSAVTKMCSTRTDCSMQAACRMWEGRMVCSTCCNQSYCNEGVPWGEEDVSRGEGSGGKRTVGGGAISYLILLVIHFLHWNRGTY